MELLEKWRPSRELDRFRDEFDDLLERFSFDRDWFGRFPGRDLLADWQTTGAMRLAIESRVEDGKFIVCTDLPGIDPKERRCQGCGRYSDDQGLARRKKRDQEG